jgi:hypothetical protein
MSAQGETISRRRPAHVPVRFLVLAVVTVVAAVAVAIQSISDDPAERLPATSVERDGAMPVQRLYPEGFGSATGSMPIQRLYPEGFGSAAQTGSMPVQRLYPEGFGSAAQTGSMPIQRLYPEGFGSAAQTGSMPAGIGFGVVLLSSLMRR